MNLALLETVISNISDVVCGWPLIATVLVLGILTTIMLGGVQFKYFLDSWRFIFAPAKQTAAASDAITPFQAFINALSASIGNGSIAGMGVAMFLGGPGAAFWILIFGIFYLSIRFSEVCASCLWPQKEPGAVLGGPMSYLKRFPYIGSALAAIYCVFILFYTFIAGSAMQSNSIGIVLNQLTGAPLILIGGVLFCALLYIAFGGSKRIMMAAEAIIPFKVGIFFITVIAVLVTHYTQIIPALILIIKSGMSWQSFSGGLVGVGIQQAMSQGLIKTINATEAGVGTAGILFGATEGQDPVRNGIMSMSTAFISNYLVCFVIMLCFVATGSWNSGLQSTALFSATISTTFGWLGCWIASFLALSFGLGVAVAYIFIGKQCWMYLTKGRGITLYNLIFCFAAAAGTVGSISIVWNLVNLVNAGLIFINVLGLVYLLPHLKKALKTYTIREKRNN